MEETIHIIERCYNAVLGGLAKAEEGRISAYRCGAVIRIDVKDTPDADS